MPLRRLAELHERIADRLEPEHYRRMPVPWLLDLDGDGRFIHWVSTVQDNSRRGVERVVPYLRRSGTKPPPCLLCDKPAYVLGLGLGKMADDDAMRRHGEFAALVAECAERTGVPEVRAVAAFLAGHLTAAREAAPSEMTDADLIAFRVGDRIVTDLPAVRAFWQGKLGDSSGEQGLQAECIVCGRIGPVVQRSPVELLLGRDRVQIVSANENAFESYGLEASEIAPVCMPCSLRYGQAANYLMTSRDHHHQIAGLHWIYWTRSGHSGGFMTILSDPQPDAVQGLLQSVFGRSGAPPLDAEAFYAAALTANTTRLVVREWLETTVGEVTQNLARWFELQSLVGRSGEPSPPMGLYGLAGSLVRKIDDLPPQTVPSLLSSALRGRPLPGWLLQQAVRRAQADGDDPVTRPRAMLVKMVLNSDPERKSPMVTAALDLSNREPAYLCGRLLAVLEDVQRAALGKVNATIVDRYFTTASSAPASVFGRLMSGAQNHLKVLRRDKPGVHAILQERIEDVTAYLDGFPRVLDLTQQGLFMLGYYQQRAEGRRQIAERAAARKAAGQPAEDDDVVATLGEDQEN